MITQAPDFRKRLAGFQRHLAPDQAALISKPTDIFYYTGFPQLAPAEREAFLLVTPEQTVLFHHSFSPAPSARSGIVSVPQTAPVAMVPYLEIPALKTLLIDVNNLTVWERDQLAQTFSHALEPLPAEWVWEQRVRKDASEQVAMKTAGQIAMKAFQRISKKIVAGMTEQDLATLLITALIQEGAQEPAFPTIVAFGANSALPHHQPTAQKLRPETPILLDFGARFQGYCSDMTRTIWFGKKPSAEFLTVEKMVHEAYTQVLKTLNSKPKNLTAQQLDAVARDLITDNGFGKQFIHTTGHGLGIEIHEPPSLGWNNETSISPDTILTVEPGIYLPGKFGYRHENTVLIAKTGTVILTV